jgi:hypothetical protein
MIFVTPRRCKIWTLGLNKAELFQIESRHPRVRLLIGSHPSTSNGMWQIGSPAQEKDKARNPFDGPPAQGL